MESILRPPAADLQLWERFQAGVCSTEEIHGSRVLERWSRCRDAGLLADNPGEPIMALESLPAARERFSPLLAPGAPFDAFATSIAKAGFCGLFCDADGLVIARRIAEPFAASIGKTKLVEGAVWSEAARGTNGVGTTLSERAPTSVIGAEHYERRNHGLACYGAPVRDIRDRIVGVLDASGPVSVAAEFIHASVVATAAAIEALLVARTYDAALPGGLFELERLLARLPHATFVVEVTGHVRRTNVPLRGLLRGHEVSDLARMVSARLAHEPTRTAWALDEAPGPLRGFELEFEPFGSPGDPFAALVHVRPRRRRSQALEVVETAPAAFAPIVGSDPALVAARARAARFAVTDLPLLLLGESGTGKELFARAIHASSTRAGGPFVAVNSGALTGTLLESELFGYAPGAFTGAASGGRVGKLATAHDGTLFLDEIGEMSAPVQAMLLRFLEDGSFFRVGEATEQRADVRLITATSRDLATLVSEGRFRGDLYFRMRGIVLRLPALRNRTDRRELAESLLARIALKQKRPKPLGLSPAALGWIERHDWPGNVRELRTALEFAVVLAGDAPRVELWHLPVEEMIQAPEQGSLLHSAERTAILGALDHSRGNLSDAARHLGVARSTLYRMLARQGLRGNLGPLAAGPAAPGSKDR
jgi:transcriptional regulator of acetoin/glycerol metabolism